jgi:hypothetical protein
MKMTKRGRPKRIPNTINPSKRSSGYSFIGGVAQKKKLNLDI